MTVLISSDKTVLIFGGGSTGLSVARFLQQKNIRYDVFDTRNNPALLRDFLAINKQTRCVLGDESLIDLTHYSDVILSPGVSREHPLIQTALEQGIPVIGDIALFLRYANAPVIGITGSNGKSTVTTMVGLAAQRAGMAVKVGGNLGTHALDLISNDAQLYVLEISSFQLESTENAGLDVAVLLNISADHMDRHHTMPTYFKVKQKIFHGASKVVYNLNDMLTQPPKVEGVERYGFGLSSKQEKSEIQYWYASSYQQLIKENDVLMGKGCVKQKGLHNIENVLALFAICDALGIHKEHAVGVAETFSGLPHRCEYVAEINDVLFINDSKATNVGASIAAIHGFVNEADYIYLIAGGVGKGADFSELGKAISEHVSAVFLYGQDAHTINAVIDKRCDTTIFASLSDAVEASKARAKPGGVVLFSPACASFDMFTNFEERGERFCQLVGRLAA